MELRKRCAAWLGLVGACLFTIGCGSDVPDPESDANAAGESVPAGGGAPRPDAAPAATPAVAANDAPKAEEATPSPTPPPAQGPQGGEAPKDQSKGQGNNSATSEMLALSGGATRPRRAAEVQVPRRQPPAARLLLQRVRHQQVARPRPARRQQAVQVHQACLRGGWAQPGRGWRAAGPIR